jgi:N utilization substance protein B
MLSRRHIRVKAMQALYAHYNFEGRGEASLPALYRSLEKGVRKMYELYLYHLVFLEEMGKYVVRYNEELRSRYVPNETELRTSLMLYQNPVMQRLLNSEAFQKEVARYGVTWQGDDDMLRRIFLDLKNQEIYKDFITFSDTNPQLQGDMLLFLVKHYPTNFGSFQQHLEELFYNWSDDKKLVQGMVVKTLQTFAAQDGVADPFTMPMSPNHEEIMEYGRNLIELCVGQDKRLEEIILPKISKWEPHQIALIDLIILKMAVCEFLFFPSIPGTVTINEYIEVAKAYSTPQSKKFVNGVLDNILKELQKGGVVQKA